LRLLDTDTCILLLRGESKVLERRAAIHDEVATSWVTAAELYYGAAKSKSPAQNRELVGRFLATLPVLGLDELATQIFGEAKALLEREGRRLDDADLLIASIAIANRAVVITGNRRHYARIPGVVIEDWIRG
jgi:tRNA(fMet)-specific endonuclease VapC